MTCFYLGVFGIIGLKRNEWTTFKIIIEFVIFWLIFQDIINIISLADPAPARSPTNFASELADVIVIIGLIVLNSYAYVRENKQ